MERVYNVAGQVFSIRNNAPEDIPFTFENYSPFEVERTSDSTVLFTLQVDVLLYSSSNALDFIKSRDCYLIDVPVWGDPKSGILKVSSSLREGRLLMKTYSRSCLDAAVLLMFALATSGRGVIVMHSSVVVNEGKGYLFLGRSGIGKSTHTSLWVKNIPGVHLLNDDNPVICVKDDMVRVYGSPWSGNTNCYLNEDYPVGAFVEISRALHNTMRRVNFSDALSIITKASVARFAIPGIAERLLDTLLRITKKHSVFILECKPDICAVKMCHDTLSQVR